jgi:hypothetical protein
MDSVGIHSTNLPRVQKQMEDVDGIRDVTRDIPNPLTGNLDDAYRLRG